MNFSITPWSDAAAGAVNAQWDKVDAGATSLILRRSVNANMSVPTVLRTGAFADPGNYVDGSLAVGTYYYQAEATNGGTLDVFSSIVKVVIVLAKVQSGPPTRALQNSTIHR